MTGVPFVDLHDAGAPAECARAYGAAGADELAMLDITATIENRPVRLDVARRGARGVTVPFTVGGGIHDVTSAAEVFEAGASRVSIGSAAVRQPARMSERIRECGPDPVVATMDVDAISARPSGDEADVDGGRTPVGLDAVEWAKRLAAEGVRILRLTSKAGDGALTGYDRPLIRALAAAAPEAELVASGGAGELRHSLEVVEAGATILLAASVVHFNRISIPALKRYLREQGVPLASG